MDIRCQTVSLGGIAFEVHTLNTLVVGSGAAGFQAADRIRALGQASVALLTEGMHMGTSRNTGSDKQTYYKLTLSGAEADSVEDMARTLFDGGAVHGDIALVQAAQSARCFLRLCDIGVPFPQNRLGEYVGYQTDHDRRRRATSAGPLTSRYMTERLEVQVRNQGIRIFDRFLAIGIVTAPCEAGDLAQPVPARKAVGLLALDMSRMDAPTHGLTLFNCTNLVWATGGPAGMYRYSVYPESQTGTTGAALEAGAVAANLTESQYGIASVKFRWNLSGTYQQVLPRYVSTDAEGGDAREFLPDWYREPGDMLDAIFLKGYQWPFDPAKTRPGGSSVIDLLVGREAAAGRRVFLDFTRNPTLPGGMPFDFGKLGIEARTYLERSGALFGTPIDRLAHMNPPAIDLYRSHGIDLTNEWLEIAVCAQHNNGGLVGDTWWESNVRHLFPVGEVNGSFGVHRPGGSALNATQVGGLRAAERIVARYGREPLPLADFLTFAMPLLQQKRALAAQLLADPAEDALTVEGLRDAACRRMSAIGAHIRPVEAIDGAMAEAEAWVARFADRVRVDTPFGLPDAFRLRDMLVTRLAYLASIRAYAAHGGGSRGSSLVADGMGNGGGMDLVEKGAGMAGIRGPESPLPAGLVVRPENPDLRGFVCESWFEPQPPEAMPSPHRIRFRWIPVRPVPERDDWFENVWRDFREGFPDGDIP